MCVKTKIRLLFVSLLGTELHGRHGFHGKRIKKIREIRVFRVVPCLKEIIKCISPFASYRTASLYISL